MVDGTLIFDTKIDSSGIKNSTQKLNKELNKSASGAGKLNKELKSTSKSAGKVHAEIKPLDTEIKSAANSAKKLDTNLGSIVGGSLKKIGGMMLAAFSVRQIVEFGKEAVGLASDLQEVQNVVDTAFGDMANQCEEFAKSSIKSFGMSELKAKQFSSTYMAMGKGSGLEAQKAADMALGATARIGDIASFYNKSFEEADTMMKSIWTGETESLKRIGVVMTEVNLQQHAHTQGIKKSYSEMTQAEKIALRYSYVMEQTALAQGDFEKTSGSWANQTRILKENFDSIKASLGTAFIQTLTPVVQMLNGLVGSLQTVADKVKEITAEMFGEQQLLDTGAGAEAEAIAEMTNAQDDYTGAIEETTKAQDRQLAGFDKLNKLSDNKNASNASAEIDIAQSASKVKSTNEEIQKTDSSLKALKDRLKNFFAPFLSEFAPLKSRFKNLGDSFKNLFSKVENPLKKWFSEDFSALIASLGGTLGILLFGHLDTALLMFQGAFDELFAPIITGLLTDFLPVITDVLTQASDLAGKVFGDIKQYVDDVFVGAILPVYKVVSTVITDLFVTLKELWEEYGEQIFNELEESWNGLIEILDIVWAELEPFIQWVCDEATALWTEHLQPVFKELGAFFAEVWVMLNNLWQNCLQPFVAFIVEKALPPIKKALERLWNIVKPIITGGIDGIKAVITTAKGLVQFLSGVFSGDLEKTLGGLKTMFSSWFNSITNVIELFINPIIAAIENFINNCIDGINLLLAPLEKLNGLEVFGKPINVQQIDNVTLKRVSIPKLATGTVVPANYGQFLSILGDNTREPEVVSPLSTMKQAVAEVLAEMGFNVEVINHLYLDSDEVTDVFIKKHNKIVKTTGKTPLKGVKAT